MICVLPRKAQVRLRLPTTALTVAIAQAMEERAERRGGRPDLPSLLALTPRGPFYDCDKWSHRDPAHLEPKRAPGGGFPDVRLQG
ncbi:hypothetical protein [Pseudarthrobacter sp. H2]|uniref:hypothetical protein n=1 Tax=Pseudarthrobacter sp. H2 TaxID=3418415 RepID=UPI003CEAE1DA